MNNPACIPFEDFGGVGLPLHFAHANGYPPGSYQPMLLHLTDNHHVYAMHMRPLWAGADPGLFRDWRPLANDIDRFLEQQQLAPVFSVGHSMGATSSLRLALAKPERFRALVLIDPVLMPPYMSVVANILFSLELSYRLNPFARGALKRRTVFESPQAMFENYRVKPVFSKLSDESLSAYVSAQACENPDGTVGLRYPAKWEARIYVTGSRADLALWRELSKLKPPLMIVRGEKSNAFSENSARLFNLRLPSARILTIPNASHLVPLEYPVEVAEAIIDFFKETIEG